MKQIILSALIVIGCIYPNLSFAHKLPLQRSKTQITKKLKSHPVESLLSGRNELDRSSRNGNKLLILLIDFVEDNDPQTTGNGKFVQDPEGYPIPIGKPPHDYLFWLDQTEVLRYYYEAVSLGSFVLDIDVFPVSAPGDFQAYTLPHEMSYYNPPGASQDLMISRFEEYFQDAFTVADQDSMINFSDYEHYMFIHAGADTQHDLNGDTPADIPSFFIMVGTGKEVIVDDGFVIDHACNVPEMITQDIDYDIIGSTTYFYNYGVINGVMVHEFGHSIGFVDLYNVFNNTPQVGYYDIMDSGGAPAIGFEYPTDSDSVYTIEGVYPALPGAWSRIIAFEDDFRNRGILKDISEFDLSKRINVLPAEKMFDPAAMNDSTAYFVKIPLNETEYLLVENRQSDPDGDGGSIPIWSPDNRVILAPSSTDLNDPNPNYEYDWLLPGWIDDTPDAKTYGGGLVIWHIDEERLYENDNYANNTINTSHSKRAVRIIEADNIDDIGNIYSMYWQGTEYEPYYRYKPIIDAEGYFQGWDDEYILNNNGQLEFIGEFHNKELSSTSLPALNSNDGEPSIYSIEDISSYSIELDEERTMSFRFGIRAFDNTEKIADYSAITAIGNVGSNYGYPTFPLEANGNVTYYSLIDQNWANNFGVSQAMNLASEYPVLPIDRNLDGEDEFQFINANSICYFSPDYIDPVTYPAALSDVPLMIDNWFSPTLIVPTEEAIYCYRIGVAEPIEIPQPNAKITFNGTHLIAATAGKITFIPDLELNGALVQTVSIPEYDPVYTPVSYIDMEDGSYNATFVQNSAGDIYRIQNGIAEEIFRLDPYTAMQPSQLALGDFTGGISLVFGASDRVFAIGLDGTLKNGFPAYLENRSIEPQSYPRIISFHDETVVLLKENNGYAAVNVFADMVLKYSFYWTQESASDQFFWDEYQEKLFYIFADNDSQLYSAFNENFTIDPIIWNGYRNHQYSIYYGTYNQSEPPFDFPLEAYAFPNPARRGEIRFKVNYGGSEISLKIYDIAGNMIHNKIVESNNTNNQDIRWNTNLIASGVYFAIIKTDGKVKKIPFAVVN